MRNGYASWIIGDMVEELFSQPTQFQGGILLLFNKKQFDIFVLTDKTKLQINRHGHLQKDNGA